MSISRNNSGFSLPELVIAMGLMGGISIVTMKLMDDQASNQAYIKGRSEISKTISLIKNTLSKGDNCRRTFAGHTVANPGYSTVTDLRVYFERNGTAYAKVLLQSGKRYPDFKSESMQIERNASTVDGTAELVLNFRIKSRNFKLWGSPGQDDPDDRIITERIPLLVTQDTANVITDCSPAVSETNAIAKKKFCDSLGAAAVWNPTLKECRFADMRCGFGEIVVNMDKLGGGTCMRIENAIDLNTLFSEQACAWTGSIKIINDMGKLRVQCN